MYNYGVNYSIVHPLSTETFKCHLVSHDLICHLSICDLKVICIQCVCLRTERCHLITTNVGATLHGQTRRHLQDTAHSFPPLPFTSPRSFLLSLIGLPSSPFLHGLQVHRIYTVC